MESQERMIEAHLKGRDIEDEKVLNSMRAVERELFVPENYKQSAYDDVPLPIGKGQTISQPYIVAFMAQAIDLQPNHRVLEVGSGCGYNAAVMTQLVSHVYSVEIIGWLALLATKNLQKAGITNVSVQHGDGYGGWSEKAPFDRIMLTAATPDIPIPLKQQLKIGGKILGPVSDTFQKLIIMEKTGKDNFITHDLLPVRFVPMTGEAEKHQ